MAVSNEEMQLWRVEIEEMLRNFLSRAEED